MFHIIFSSDFFTFETGEQFWYCSSIKLKVEPLVL